MKALSVDLRSLAAVRIGVAALILYDLADRARFLRLHYTDAGIFPRAAVVAQQAQAQWSLHLATGTSAGVAVLFLVAAAFAAGLLVGWHTRVCAVASWILLVSLQNRAPAVDYGADAMLRALLFFLVFTPLAARFSVDARRAPPLPDTHRSLPSLALLLQISAVYVFTAVLKLQQLSWRNLTAVYFALNTDHHATYFGLFVGRSLAAAKVLAAATLFVEIGAPLLLLLVPRWQARVAAFALVVAFHVGTAACLHLGYFPWIGVVAWAAVLPAEAWERVAKSATIPGVHRDGAGLFAPVRAVLAGVAIVVVIAANVASAWPALKLPRPVAALARAVSMDQRWVMFIRPMHDGWFTAPATLADGRVIDMLAHGAPVDEKKPAHVADQFPNMRWRKLITDMQNGKRGSAKSRALFLRRLCADWNAGVGDERNRMQSVELVFLQEDDRVDGTRTPVVKRVLGHRDCR